MVVNIIANYCCTRKMLRETEERIVFFIQFLSLIAFCLGGGLGPLPPSGDAYGRLQSKVVEGYMLN